MNQKMEKFTKNSLARDRILVIWMTIMTFKTLILLSILLISTWALQAQTVQILSPDVQHSYVYGSVNNTYLTWDEEKKVMQAWIEYTNYPYSQNSYNMSTDDLVFTIPGVTYDSLRGLYTVTNGKGQSIAFARHNDTSQLTRKVLPLSNVRLTLDNIGGTFMLYLFASNDKGFDNGGTPWVERTHGFHLGNLISSETAIP